MRAFAAEAASVAPADLPHTARQAQERVNTDVQVHSWVARRTKAGKLYAEAVQDEQDALGSSCVDVEAHCVHIDRDRAHNGLFPAKSQTVSRRSE